MALADQTDIVSLAQPTLFDRNPFRCSSRRRSIRGLGKSESHNITPEVQVRRLRLPQCQVRFLATGIRTGRRERDVVGAAVEIADHWLGRDALVCIEAEAEAEAEA